MNKAFIAVIVVITSALLSMSCADADTDTPQVSGCNETPIEHKVGDFYQGGVIFWIDPATAVPYQRGLIAAVTDQPGGFVYKWDNRVYYTPVGAKGNDYYAGSNTPGGNTYIIMSRIGRAGEAAETCVKYKGGNYTDWYLPSLVELAEIFAKRYIITDTALQHGGTKFQYSRYWSSTEDNLYHALYYNFTGYRDYFIKRGTIPVRCIRAIEPEEVELCESK